MKKNVKGSEKSTSFGSCRIQEFKPKREKWNEKTSIINTIISFDEALRLKLILESALLKMNKYKRNSTEGKNAGIDLAINLKGEIISILEATPKKKQKEK